MDANNATSASRSNGIGIFIAAVALLIFMLSVLCLNLNHHTDPLSPVWLSTAAMLAALFYCPWRYWPAMVIVGGLAIIAAYALMSSHTLDSLPLTGVSLAESALGAWLLKLMLNPRDPLDGIVPWLKFFLVGVLLVPSLGALAAGYFADAAQTDYLTFVPRWFTAEAIGILALTPVGLLCRRQALLQMIKQRSWLELLLMIALTLAISYFALRFLPFPFTYIILPLLIGAVRLPRFEAFGLFLVTTLALLIILGTGLINMDLPPSTKLAVILHIPLLMILIPAHAMAMAMYAFQLERGHISQSETRFRNAMEYSAIGMALVSLEGSWMQVNKALCRFLGYSAPELKKLSFQEITYADDLSSDLTQLNDLVNGHIESYTLEKRYIRSDGEIVWALLAVSLVRDQHDQPLYFISQIEDITEVKHNNIINQRLMERITLANEAGGVGIWEWDVEAKIMSWDKRMREIYAVQPAESVSYEYWLERILEEDRPLALQTLADSLEKHKPFLLGFRIRNPGDDIRHIRAYANTLMDENGRVERMLGVNLDMTGEVRLREALYEEKERLHITLDSIGDAVISVDRQLRVNFMNPVAENMTGWRQEKAHGRHIDGIMHISAGVDGPRLPMSMDHVSGAAHGALTIEQDFVLNNRKGTLFDIHYSCTPLKNLKGDVLGAVLVIKDVSESRQLLQQLSYNASHDVLTGLPNRASFKQHLDAALLAATREKRRHALVFIDLDRFKQINDSAGHAAGDALLLELGLLMQDNIRQYDCLARLGGDEFGLILTDCPLPEAQALAQRIIDAVNAYRFYWQDQLYRIGGSAGVTLISEDNFNAQEVMAQADTACYAAKHSGRGRVLSYEPPQPLAGAAARRATLSHERLLDMMGNDLINFQVEAVASPLARLSVDFFLLGFDIQAPALQAAGALPVPVSQDELTIAARAHDLSSAVDGWLLKQLFYGHGAAIGGQGIILALPLSVQGVCDPTITDELLSLGERHPQLNAQMLIISLDGKDFMDQYPAITRAIDPLRQYGYKIMLTQFGADLGVFNKLRAGQIDYIRLPDHFIGNVHCSQMDDIMVRVINGHVHRLQARSLAGPARLPATLDTLGNIGVDLATGETIGQRLPLSAMLDKGNFASR
ncbi:diguanylate cyclase [Acerihabitans arboris]|uniref:diguanylate cyclase n=1 Tax=Acerihabitans arboris TaxID=2691583 RepID=A0A845SS91_9GAMM|nr:diguanylate cyclase [Acerihabitans arboris]NDL65391.1 diguanylate cyclase [Acerihabitans arboris]